MPNFLRKKKLFYENSFESKYLTIKFIILNRKNKFEKNLINEIVEKKQIN